MTGLWFEHEGLNQLVTLTTQANEACAEIHGRMPLIIEPEEVNNWLNIETRVTPLFQKEKMPCTITKIENTQPRLI
jgi:putative SOS response-associated peptidase YedK